MKKFKELSPDELKELKGALYAAELVNDDILNHNSISGCECTYRNLGAIENRNDVSGCKCTCN